MSFDCTLLLDTTRSLDILRLWEDVAILEFASLYTPGYHCILVMRYAELTVFPRSYRVYLRYREQAGCDEHVL